jgi:hypothetical protein
VQGCLLLWVLPAVQDHAVSATAPSGPQNYEEDSPRYPEVVHLVGEPDPLHEESGGKDSQKSNGNPRVPRGELVLEEVHRYGDDRQEKQGPQAGNRAAPSSPGQPQALRLLIFRASLQALAHLHEEGIEV